MFVACVWGSRSARAVPRSARARTRARGRRVGGVRALTAALSKYICDYCLCIQFLRSIYRLTQTLIHTSTFKLAAHKTTSTCKFSPFQAFFRQEHDKSEKCLVQVWCTVLARGWFRLSDNSPSRARPHSGQLPRTLLDRDLARAVRPREGSPAPSA